MLKPIYPLCIFPARFLYIRFSSIILSYVSMFIMCVFFFPSGFPPRIMYSLLMTTKRAESRGLGVSIAVILFV